MKQNNEESLRIQETNKCNKNDIVYCVECWFLSMLTLFSFFFFCFFKFVFSSFVYFYNYVFLSLESQTHEYQTVLPLGIKIVLIHYLCCEMVISVFVLLNAIVMIIR